MMYSAQMSEDSFDYHSVRNHFDFEGPPLCPEGLLCHSHSTYTPLESLVYLPVSPIRWQAPRWRGQLPI